MNWDLTTQARERSIAHHFELHINPLYIQEKLVNFANLTLLRQETLPFFHIRSTPYGRGLTAT